MFANENSKLAWDVTLLVHCLSSMHDTQRMVAHIDNFRILGGEGKIKRRTAHHSLQFIFSDFSFRSHTSSEVTCICLYNHNSLMQESQKHNICMVAEEDTHKYKSMMCEDSKWEKKAEKCNKNQIQVR